jgi:L-amino acid N-acyltransferase
MSRGNDHTGLWLLMTIHETSRRDGLQIRLAGPGDLGAINDIYNYYVLHSTCTYQESPEPMEGREKWFTQHGPVHPVIVAEMDGRIAGWGSLSAYHVRSAYRHTVENSVYIHHEFHRRGIGTIILADLIERARTIGHRAIIAGIDGDQLASVKLHAKFGFETVGHFKQLGFKFGRWLDVIYMELLL